MENRRQPTGIPPRPSIQNSNHRNEEQRPYGAKSFQPRDNRFQTGRDRLQNRDEKSQSDGGFQPRDGGGRFQPRDNKFQPRGRFAPKGAQFKPWEKEKPLPRIVSEMQVTDGKHRGKYLKSTASEKVRPTARRVREVMFRILYRRVRAGRFLDLCAGSGMVGIEAISRGALIGTFVERSAKMCGFIKKNLEACGIKEGHGEVVQIEAVPFLKQMHKRKRYWDVVYFDPPYDSNYEEVLAYFSRGAAIKPKGVLVIEHPSDMFFPEKFGVMSRWRVLVQGETTLSFYERN
ncbi:MAG TPA: 16S rRNA (guanine(966)-N(2))-methyltransferase RsmD [Pyrinomonadaceae bacterium]|nr:16S rRNA (guanine(966)-N(2))-methyltransferase RsmD [Pyrinomonadaceae bacterium]